MASNVVNLAGEPVAPYSERAATLLGDALDHAKTNKVRGIIVIMLDPSGNEILWSTDHDIRYHELLGAMRVAEKIMIERNS